MYLIPLLTKFRLQRKKLLNTFSPNSYGLDKKDAALKEVLQKIARLVFDGMGIAIGIILLHGKILEKSQSRTVSIILSQNH